MVEHRRLGLARRALQRGGMSSGGGRLAGRRRPGRLLRRRLRPRRPRARGARWPLAGARRAATRPSTSVRLCARAGLRPATLVEIGCGEGAVLAELAARASRPALDGFELSRERHRAGPQARGIPGAGRLEAYDGALRAGRRRRLRPRGAHPRARARRRRRRPCWREAARVARWVLVEVPLEANRPPPGRPSARWPPPRATSRRSTGRRSQASCAAPACGRGPS